MGSSGSTRKVDVWAEGGFNLRGSLTVNKNAEFKKKVKFNEQIEIKGGSGGNYVFGNSNRGISGGNEAGNLHIDGTNDLYLNHYTKKNTVIGGNLAINGNLTIKGKKPIAYKIYQISTDNPSIKTEFKKSEYVLCIVGFNAGSDDEIEGVRIIPIAPANQTNWYIRADLKGVKDAYWDVVVLAIKQEMVDVKGFWTS